MQLIDCLNRIHLLSENEKATFFSGCQTLQQTFSGCVSFEDHFDLSEAGARMYFELRELA